MGSSPRRVRSPPPDTCHHRVRCKAHRRAPCIGHHQARYTGRHPGLSKRRPLGRCTCHHQGRCTHHLPDQCKGLLLGRCRRLRPGRCTSHRLARYTPRPQVRCTCFWATYLHLPSVTPPTKQVAETISERVGPYSRCCTVFSATFKFRARAGRSSAGAPHRAAHGAWLSDALRYNLHIGMDCQ